MKATPLDGPARSAIHDPRSSVSTLRVRYSETDQMGFVYHPHYLVWCEVARTDFIRGIGPSYAQLEQEGWLLAVIDASIRFIAPGRYDDLVRVTCRLERVQSRSITFSYEIERIEPGPVQLLSTASTRLIALDRSGAPRTLPPELLQRFRDAVAAPIS
ncbi:MAG: thioesterase family protein [Gemmatimonadota bacterium]